MLQKGETFDIAVVGGGAIGLSCAWKLAQDGARVALFEAGALGHEASWAAAGMLAAQLEAARHPPASRDGAQAERAREFFKLCLHSRALWPAFAEETGEVGLHWGAFYVSTRDDDDTPLRLKTQAGAGPVEARDFAGRPALWLAQEGRVDNRRLMRALESRARSAGVVIREREAVRAVRMRGGRVAAVETERGATDCGALLLCAGAWSGRIEGLPALPLRPVAGEMIALRCDALQSDALQDVVYASDVYLVPRAVKGERWIIAGATVEERGFDKSLHASAATGLRERARAVMPRLRDAPLVEHWAGLRPATPDGLPLLGRFAAPNCWAATGHFRNGILLTPATAQLIAGAILRGDALPEAFSPLRFAAETSQ